MTQLVKREEAAVQSSDVLQKLLELAQRKDVDPATVQTYFDMHRQMREDERREDFDDAMSRVQKQLPQQINKYGQGKNSRFAKLEDIDVIVRPLLAEEGFSLAFNEESTSETTATFVLEVSRAGHTKPFKRTFHHDKASLNREGKGIRPAIQDDGSTTSYARRILLKMALNIIEKDEDTDGADTAYITEEQAREINTLLLDTKPADRPIENHRQLFLCKIALTNSIEEIPAREFQRVMNALLTKARMQK